MVCDMFCKDDESHGYVSKSDTSDCRTVDLPTLLEGFYEGKGGNVENHREFKSAAECIDKDTEVENLEIRNICAYADSRKSKSEKITCADTHYKGDKF